MTKGTSTFVEGGDDRGGVHAAGVGGEVGGQRIDM
jgi:hypothetical protein